MKKNLKQPSEEIKPSQAFQFDIAVLRIANLGFSVDESIDLGEKVDLSYSFRIRCNPDNNFVELTLSSIYRLNPSDNPFFTSSAMTKFFVGDLKRFAHIEDPAKVTLPDGILHTLFSIAFTHARAIQMTNASSTKFSSLILPLINPAELFNNLMRAAGAERNKISL